MGLTQGGERGGVGWGLNQDGVLVFGGGECVRVHDPS